MNVNWACVLLCLAQASALAAQDFAARAGDYLDAQSRVNRFSGSVLLIKDGEVVLKKNYGMADVEHDVPNSTRTKFRIGSLTKQFTATAILQLEERGKLGLEDSVCKYIEDCPAAWQAITIHHLLTHTSGLPNLTSFPEYRQTMMLPSRPQQTILRFKDRPLDFSPGEKFAYSNSGYIVLALILEKVSGQSYESYLRQHIFEPLGMKDSGSDSHEAILKNRAKGYTIQSAELVHAPYHDMTIPIGGGNLYSTVEDLRLWDQALYGEGVLKKESVDKMFTVFKGDYGYGWMIRNLKNHRLIGHAGGINGFSSFIARFPDEKCTVIVLSNLETASAGRIGQDLSAILFGLPYEMPAERPR